LTTARRKSPPRVGSFFVHASSTLTRRCHGLGDGRFSPCPVVSIRRSGLAPRLAYRSPAWGLNTHGALIPIVDALPRRIITARRSTQTLDAAPFPRPDLWFRPPRRIKQSGPTVAGASARLLLRTPRRVRPRRPGLTLILWAFPHPRRRKLYAHRPIFVYSFSFAGRSV
jgi:hypothetical protein